MNSITRRLSEFSSSLAFADLPEAIVSRAKLLLLDQVACELAGATTLWSRQVREATISSSGPGSARIVLYGDALGPEQAAFVNSAFGHSNEIDDTHLGARTHPGSVIIPAVMAMAQYVAGTTAEEFLTAMVAGYEVMLRVSLAVMPSLMDVRNHNSAPAVGPFGVAAACCKIGKSGSRDTEHALAIAAHQSSGLLQYVVGGGSVKRLQTAFASRAGVSSALLAIAGITGPEHAIEGRRGFIRAFSEEDDPDRALTGLGHDFLMADVGFKFHNVKYRLHSSVDAILSILAERSFGWRDIDRIEIGVTSSTLRAVGRRTHPRDAVEGQLNIPFVIAVVAKFGSAILGRLSDFELNDRDVLALAQRVDMVLAQPSLDSDWACHMTVTTSTGVRVSKDMPGPYGSILNPVGQEEVEAKFAAMAEPVVGEERTAAIIGVVADFEHSEPAQDLFRRLYDDR